jgi:competence protein ComEA
MSKNLSKIIISILAVSCVGIASANANVPPVSANTKAPAVQTSVPNSAKVNINTATAEQLASGTLKGIGLAKAKTIIAYRNEHGKFNSADDLAKVKGIGPKLVERNRNMIAVN